MSENTTGGEGSGQPQWAPRQVRSSPRRPDTFGPNAIGFPAARSMVQSDPAPPIRLAAGLCVLATAAASAWLLGDGFGFGIPILAALLAVTAVAAGRSGGRTFGRWNAAWGCAAIGVLCLAAWRGEPGPYLFAVFCAIVLGALAVHGGRSWLAVLLGWVGFPLDCSDALAWGWRGARELAARTRSGNTRNLSYGIAAALGLVVVFGALFAAADPVFARLWDSVGSVFDGWSPLPVLWFLIGAAGALTVAYSAVSPIHFDRFPIRPANPLSRVVWLMPLAALALLFAVFDVIQVSVLFGGYRAVLRSSDMTYAQYARQGFWQLISATVLTLIVISAAIRWSPRGGARDAKTTSVTLCTLCVLTLIVVGSALRRMQMDIDGYGLTLPRVAVVAIEIWLGLLFLVLLAARCRPATTWLPRGTAISAVLVVAAFTAIGPAHLVAQVDVDRYFSHQYVDLSYLNNLPADARPEIARLPQSVQNCLPDPQDHGGSC